LPLTLKKPKSTRFIKYDEPNDEPVVHIQGKIRIHHLLSRFGYRVLTNTEKMEYKLPVIHTELDGDKHYQIDALMYDEKTLRVIAVEVNGPYHYANKTRIGKTRQKHEEISNWFKRRGVIKIDEVKYDYKMQRCIAFKTEELVGKHQLNDGQVLDRVLWQPE
jgi:hypothetical protein